LHVQATSESVSTRQREGGSLPCSVNEVQLINFTQGDYNGDSSTRASLEDLRLRWGSNSSMHKLVANQETSSRSSPKPANSPIGTEMITFESRSADECLESEFGCKDGERKEPRSKLGLSQAQALQQEKQVVMEKANLLAKQESDREMAAFSCKNSVNLEVNQKEPEEVDKQHTLFNENILKVLLVL